MISLSVEQLEYIYCGDKIRHAAGRLSCCLIWIYMDFPFTPIENNGFLAKVWIRSSKSGLVNSLMLLTATWQILAAYAVPVNCNDNRKLFFWTDFRFWNGHSFDSFVTLVPHGQEEIGDLHAP